MVETIIIIIIIRTKKPRILHNPIKPKSHEMQIIKLQPPALPHHNLFPHRHPLIRTIRHNPSLQSPLNLPLISHRPLHVIIITIYRL